MSKHMPSLREAYAKYFKIGAAVSPRDFALYGDILEEHFNSLTGGNAMKFEPIHPQKDVWDFKAADEIAAINFPRPSFMLSPMAAIRSRVDSSNPWKNCRSIS